MPDTFLSDVTAAPQTTNARELEADTHAMVASGALAVTAIDTILGTLTLPAGGEWTIFGVWSQVVNATNTAAQAISGYMRLESVNGDINPNPAPTRFPFPMIGSYLGATAPVSASPLRIYPVRFTAPGKAQVQLIFHQNTVNTVAPQAIGGIIFGKTIPADMPFVYVDSVRVTTNAASDTAIGTITLAEKARMITAVAGIAIQDGVLTTAEELIGRFRISSDDIKFPPADYPLSAAFSAGVGALINQGDYLAPVFIPVSIPVVGGARLDCFVDLNTALTNAAEVEVFISYV